MATTTKRNLIDRIAIATNTKRVLVRKVVQKLLDEIVEEIVKGRRIEFRDFGVFECKDRKARVAQNPKTLDKVSVPPRKTVKFKPGRTMRARLEATCEPLVQAAQNLNHRSSRELAAEEGSTRGRVSAEAKTR